MVAQIARVHTWGFIWKYDGEESSGVKSMRKQTVVKYFRTTSLQVFESDDLKIDYNFILVSETFPLSVCISWLPPGTHEYAKPIARWLLNSCRSGRTDVRQVSTWDGDNEHTLISYLCILSIVTIWCVSRDYQNLWDVCCRNISTMRSECGWKDLWLMKPAAGRRYLLGKIGGGLRKDLYLLLLTATFTRSFWKLTTTGHDRHHQFGHTWHQTGGKPVKIPSVVFLWQSRRCYFSFHL